MEPLVRERPPETGTAIVLFFRLLGPNNETARCCSYRVGSSIEVRFGVDGEMAFLAEAVASHGEALTLACEWRTRLKANGFVEPEA